MLLIYHSASINDCFYLIVLFAQVRAVLPNSTESDVLLLNVALEYAAMWIKHPKSMKLLERSVESVLALRSNLLRHGTFSSFINVSFICVMIILCFKQECVECYGRYLWLPFFTTWQT